jgi:hypothetical protein
MVFSGQFSVGGFNGFAIGIRGDREYFIVVLKIHSPSLIIEPNTIHGAISGPVAISLVENSGFRRLGQRI